MINYIIQVLIFQTLFLAVYDLFLKKETFFQWNRLYLILSSVLTYVIPFIKINSIGNYVQEEFILPEVFVNPEAIFLNEVSINKQTSAFTLENFYFLGLAIMTVLFLFKVTQIIRKINANKVIKNTDYRLVIIKKENNAFSFFNYIFLGETIYQKEHQHILKHELTHVKQRHSLDLLFFEFQKIVFWINPFSYVYQNKISTLHEYIADEKTIKIEDKTPFFENLLNQTFNVEKITFVNNYFKQSLLKKRIIMATKNKSKQILKMKYLLILPLLFAMLVVTSCDSEIEEKTELEAISFTEYKDLDQDPYLKDTDETDPDERKIELLSELIKIAIDNMNQKYVKDVKTKPENEKTLFIKFIVDKNGNNVNFDYSDIPDYLKSEAKRLMKFIPKIMPGIKDGENVNVRLTMPLIIYKNLNSGIRPFSSIEKTPVFPGCENLTTNEDLKNCLNEKIKKHIGKNFNIDLAQGLGLEFGKKRISVQFIINKDGLIEAVKSRAPHPKLEEEAIRIINLLPQMIAGEQDGKKVKVRYNLPITFMVED